MNASACVRCENTTSLNASTSSGTMPAIIGTAPASRREQRVRVRVADLPVVGVPRGRDQLVPGREHDDARAWMHERMRQTGGREEPQLRRLEAAPRQHERLAGSNVLAARADVFAPDRRGEDANVAPCDLAGLDRRDRVGARRDGRAGTGRPVAVAKASPPPTVPSGRSPIKARPTMRSSTGAVVVADAISEERTANPSIAEDAKSGMSRSATGLSASTQP